MMGEPTSSRGAPQSRRPRCLKDARRSLRLSWPHRGTEATIVRFTNDATASDEASVAALGGAR